MFDLAAMQNLFLTQMVPDNIYRAILEGALGDHIGLLLPVIFNLGASLVGTTTNKHILADSKRLFEDLCSPYGLPCLDGVLCVSPSYLPCSP